MRKLTLNLEDLRVDSFATGRGTGLQDGTVRGFATVTCPAEPQPATVEKTEWATCAYTCDDATCQGSCHGTSCYPPACTACPSFAVGCVIPTRVC